MKRSVFTPPQMYFTGQRSHFPVGWWEGHPGFSFGKSPELEGQGWATYACFLEAQRIQAKAVPAERGWQNTCHQVDVQCHRNNSHIENWGSETEGDVLFNNHTFSFYQKWGKMWKDSGSNRQACLTSLCAHTVWGACCRPRASRGPHGPPEGPSSYFQLPVSDNLFFPLVPTTLKHSQYQRLL